MDVGTFPGCPEAVPERIKNPIIRFVFVHTPSVKQKRPSALNSIHINCHLPAYPNTESFEAGTKKSVVSIFSQCYYWHSIMDESLPVRKKREQNLDKKKRYRIITAIIMTIIFIDHITKIIAKATLRYSTPKIYLWDFFRFQYAENTGAMLGLGSSLPESVRFWLLTVLVGILLFVLLAYVLFGRHLSNLQIISLSLISGGGLSNFIDRIINNGRVVDFMNMGIGWLRTGIFNVADVMIMIGMGLILIFGISKPRSSMVIEESPDSEEQSS